MTHFLVRQLLSHRYLNNAASTQKPTVLTPATPTHTKLHILFKTSLRERLTVKEKKVLCHWLYTNKLSLHHLIHHHPMHMNRFRTLAYGKCNVVLKINMAFTKYIIYDKCTVVMSSH